ncbi:MAG: protein phosphatase 2C domain-containing protein [Opitutaceae bacterium]
MIQIRAAALTDIGRVRRQNEDRLILDEERLVFGVADGVGGIPGGAEAAQEARDFILRSFHALPPEDEPDLQAIILGANRAVAEKGATVSPSTGIASTLTFGCARKGRLLIGHVGDSRCYRFGSGRLDRLTQDHSVENEASKRRLLGEAAYYSPLEARALTQWLGSSGLPKPDCASVPLVAGDRFLFCTDGVTVAVSDREIGSILGLPEEPDAQLRRLIGLALSRGGIDNATGVLLRVDLV